MSSGAGYGDTAADLKPATVTVATDVPYLLASAKSQTLLATYSNVDSSMRALAKVLAGKARTPARSPVPGPGLPAFRPSGLPAFRPSGLPAFRKLLRKCSYFG